LTDIWKHTLENWTEEQADEYYQLLILDCSYISKNPTLGKNYDGIVNSLLGFRAQKHIIFYRIIAENQIEIFRILHGKMDLKHRIKE